MESATHLRIRWYEIDGQYQFQLCSRNGEALLTSERYKTEQAMNKAIGIVLNRPIAREIFKANKPNKEDI